MITHFDSAADALNQFHVLDREAVRTQDLDSLLSLYTEDCILIPPSGQPVSGRDEIRKFMSKQFEESGNYRMTKYEQKFEEVRIFDGWAYEWGLFKGVYHILNGVPDIFDSSRIFRVLHLQPDGTWKAARIIWQYL